MIAKKFRFSVLTENMNKEMNYKQIEINARELQKKKDVQMNCKQKCI